jgi:hypothetical protein
LLLQTPTLSGVGVFFAPSNRPDLLGGLEQTNQNCGRKKAQKAQKMNRDFLSSGRPLRLPVWARAPHRQLGSVFDLPFRNPKARPA